MFGPIPGMDFLGSTVLTSAALTTATVTIAPRDVLYLLVRVTGYSGVDIASLRFNGDTANNYWSKTASAANSATAMTVAASAVSASPFTGMAKMHPTAVTTSRMSVITISNFLSVEKLATVTAVTGSGSTSGGTLECNALGWVNTTAQITSIAMMTPTNNLSIGSGFAVFGRNF